MHLLPPRAGARVSREISPPVVQLAALASIHTVSIRELEEWAETEFRVVYSSRSFPRASARSPGIYDVALHARHIRSDVWARMNSIRSGASPRIRAGVTLLGGMGAYLGPSRFIERLPLFGHSSSPPRLEDTER